MLNLDLHCHSTYSDGLLSPLELVQHAQERGVKMLALTDHDGTEGVAEAHECAKELGIQFINGVEISAAWNNIALHIVGLRIDASNQHLVAQLQQIRSGRMQRAERIAAELDKAGITGSLAGAHTYAKNAAMIGRAHFGRYLLERGVAADMRTVFKRYLVSGKPGYVAHEWPDLAKVVGWINNSGGIAVLAHPARYKLRNVQLTQLLTYFKEVGGGAIEVITSSHSAEEVQFFAKQARFYGLLASAGSDYHGPRESSWDLGRLPELPEGCSPVWQNWVSNPLELHST